MVSLAVIRHRRHPDLFCRLTPQDSWSFGGADGKRLVIIALLQANFCSGPDGSGFEEFEELAVTFVDAVYGVGLAGFSIGE